MRLPSIKTLATIASERARELRSVLEIKTYSQLHTVLASGKYPATSNWVRSCHNEPNFMDIKMSICDEILGTCGVEYIPRGHNAKSPAITYCNTGDTYDSTLMYVNGQYRVGSWGDIVERGSYN